jgi:hypothetical protein
MHVAANPSTLRRLNSVTAFLISLVRPLRPKHRRQLLSAEVDRVQLLQIFHVKFDDFGELIQIAFLGLEPFPLQYGNQILLDYFVHGNLLAAIIHSLDAQSAKVTVR